MSEKHFDIVAMGELLVDFTDDGLSEQGNTLFEANPGGASRNVLTMLRKLGYSCAAVIPKALIIAWQYLLSPPK